MKRAVAGLQPVWRLVMCLGVLVIVLDLTGVFTPPSGLWWVVSVVVAVFLAFLLYRTTPTAGGIGPITVDLPVQGRWQVHNSSGQKVPSHGTPKFGQEYAVDLSHPTVGDDMVSLQNPAAPLKALRGTRPETFTCFGEPVHAMAEGVVVRVSERQRDRRARNTWQALLWVLLVEGTVRELVGGHRAVVGNHIVIRHDDGMHSAYAHLRRGSARVVVGDQVAGGDVIAEVGSTGNSTEPHLHVQLMDRASFGTAAGLPMMWRGLDVHGLDPSWEPRAREPEESALLGMPRDGTIVRTAADRAAPPPEG